MCLPTSQPVTRLMQRLRRPTPAHTHSTLPPTCMMTRSLVPLAALIIFPSQESELCKCSIQQLKNHRHAIATTLSSQQPHPFPFRQTAPQPTSRSTSLFPLQRTVWNPHIPLTLYRLAPQSTPPRLSLRASHLSTPAQTIHSTSPPHTPAPSSVTPLSLTLHKAHTPSLMLRHCTLPPTFHHSLSCLGMPTRCCAILLDSSPPVLPAPCISHIISSVLTQEGQILNPPGGVRVVRALSSESDLMTHSASPRAWTAVASSATVAHDTNATNSTLSLLHPHRSPRPCFLTAATPHPPCPFPRLLIASPRSPQTMPTSPLLPGVRHKSAPP